MATKIVVISDTKIRGEHVEAGTEMSFDELTNDGKSILGELNAANRIVIHGSEGHKLWVEDQEKLEKARKAAEAKASKGKSEKSE